MNYKLKQILTSWRIILLLILVVFSLIAISPHPGREGVTIAGVVQNSSAYQAGMQSPKDREAPVVRERIVEINDQPVATLEDYYSLTSDLEPNATLYVKTDKATYRLRTKFAFEIIPLNDTELVVVEEEIIVNESINGTVQEVVKTVNVTKEVPKVEKIVTGTEEIGLEVYSAPTSNIRKGLDLQGGTRVLLQPEVLLTPQDLDTLMESMRQRLNVYGLSDVPVKEAGDLSGNQYILVEIAGASEAEIKRLLAQQGKFEAKVADTVVFRGGNNDIPFVCRSANCAGIDPNRGCFISSGQHVCGFSFSITLSSEAAERQAQATLPLEVIEDPNGRYLSSPLELFLDDVKVDQLNIAADLQGQATTNIQISGTGFGTSQEAAAFDALNNMKQLQTILITGSLPVQLNVVKADEISPILGREFVRNSFIMAIIAILSVAIIVAIRYRKAIIAVPIIATMTSELIILLGTAAFINWNIDLAAIAGIIAAIGTGVDDQIVITDETLRGSMSTYSWKERIKRAFLIIMLAYVTVFVAMLPLVFAGAGLLRGFALTTIIGVTLGVFITRPAFSKMLEVLLK